METRFVAYDRLGARRGVLPDFLKAELVPTKNELSTLTLKYPRSSPTHPYLQNNPEVAFEYYHEGKWVEPMDARFRLLSTDYDHLEEVATKDYTFIAIGEALAGVYVYNNLGLGVTDDGKVKFGNATPGGIIARIWEYANSRGWTGLTKTFNATVDSNGVPWPTKMNTSFAMEDSIQSVLNYLARCGLCDFHWEGRKLHMYVNETDSRDLSVGPSPLRFNLSGGPAGIDAAPESTDREQMATHVVVLGEEGLRWEFPTGARLPEGRREVFLTFSGVDDRTTASILALPTITKYSNATTNTTRQFRISPTTTKLPFIDYGVGDYALVEKDNGTWERMQIYSVSLLIDAGGVQGYVGLGDRIDSLIERMNEDVQRITGAMGGEGTTPVAPSQRRPSAPKNLIASADSYIDGQGQPKAMISIGFEHDGKDDQGLPVEVAIHKVQYRVLGDSTWLDLFNIDAPRTAGTYAPLDTYYRGALRTYQFRVISINTRLVQSMPSATVTVEVKPDPTPPPTPSKLKATAEYGIFTVETDHRTFNDLKQDADYNHMIVEMATAPNGKPWVNVGIIWPPTRSLMIPNQGYVTRWFRAIAVDSTGNASEPSEISEATTKPLVDADIILSEIDAAKTIIKNAGAIALESGKKLADKLAEADTALADTERKISGPGGLTEKLTAVDKKLADVGSLTYATGQTLRQKLTANDTAIKNANDALTGTGGVTDRLAAVDQKLTLTRTANAIPDPMFVDPAYVARVNQYSTCTVALNSAGDMTLTGTAAATYFRPLGQPQTVAGYKNWIPVKPGQRWRFDIELADVTVAGGWIWYTGRTIDGAVYANPANSARVTVPVGGGTVSVEIEVPANCYWIMPEMMIPANAGTIVVKKGSMVARQSITQELLVDGVVMARHVAATEEMSAKLGSFLKLDVKNLVASNANLDEGVANKFFANIFATNRLTASQVFIGEGGNLMGDPDFLDPEGWDSNGNLIVKNAGRNGNNALVIPSRTSQVGGYYGSGDRNRQFAVVPGASYKLSTWVKPSIEVPAKSISVYMKWTNPDTASTGQFATPGNISNDQPLPAGEWSQVTGIVKLPDEAVKGFIGLYVQASTTAEVAFSEPSVVQAVDTGLIVENAIAARHIEASESMSAKLGSFLKLDVGSLTATGSSKFSEVVSTRMFTDIFSANKITASEMVIGVGPNLIPNGAGEWGKAGAWSTGLTWDTSDKPAGLPGSFRSDAGQGTLAINDFWFDLEAGESYMFEFWIKTNKAENRLYIEIRDQTGTLLPGWKEVPGEPFAGQSSYPAANLLVPTVWTRYRATVTIPAGVHKARIGAIYFNHPNSTNRDATVRMAGLRMIRRMDASLTVDGSIYTRHLTITEDMTVELLKAHKVKAAEIDTNSLAADNAFVGNLEGKIITSNVFSGKSFTGGTFTGSTFQTTAAANRGVTLNGSGLNAFDQMGRSSFVLNGSTGSASLVGRFSSGHPGENRWMILPEAEHVGNRTGIWNTNSTNGLGGEETAGMFLDNPSSNVANYLKLRGMNGAGVEIVGRLLAQTDIYAGTILGPSATYRFQGANGSYFTGSLETRGRLFTKDTPATSLAANAHISSSDGLLYRSSSASRYKIDKREAQLPDSLLDIPVMDWIDKAQVDRLVELESGPRPFTEETQRIIDCTQINRVPGVIAEDVEAAGGALFVGYNNDGMIESVDYDRLAIARTAILKRQLDALADKLAELKGK